MKTAVSKKLVLITALLFAGSAFAQSTTYTRIGNHVFGSNGTSMTQIGDHIFVNGPYNPYND